MGNTNTITLENKTTEDIAIIEIRGIIPGKTVKAGGSTIIQPEEYDGDDSRGGQLPILKILCGGSILRSPKGPFLLPGDKLFSPCFETVTIDCQPEDQNSTGVVNYEVKFQPRDAAFTVDSLKVMTLDPSKLFASIDDPETLLLCEVLKFWPRTFTDLNSKDDLVKTVGVVNDLMVQAKEYNADRLKGEYNADRLEGEVAKVMEKVSDLNKLCAAKVEWYRPLFPGMEKKFPPVAEPMGKVDQVKLQNFTTTIAPLLRQRNSLAATSS